ncbi:MAG: PhoPQ-activated pathogenicity-like protein PqaA type [Verrucomicrobia bacterium]|nr:PhoPQ-activated pathogenicity-like protein PqaA type [Verrucomicrobiota bacterium]
MRFPGRFRPSPRSAFAAVFVAVCVGTGSGHAGALEDYVRQPDKSFNWKRTRQTQLKEGGTLTHLELISQTWRGQFWSHHLLVYRPPVVRHPDAALLVISGGGYNAPAEKEVLLFQPAADRAGALLAFLNKVPNQPLYDGRTEDALIAYTFNEFLKSGDTTWPALFPMVKSAVRAMDTVSAFTRAEWDQPVKRIAVTGASKRGWTTWLTAAVDRRVFGIAPMVIDVLNMRDQLLWAEKVYGRQSEEISDYTQLNLHLRMDDPPMKKLRSWVDPYSYRARYTLPKLLLLGTNDAYWTVDSLRHYWSDLPEPKLVFQTPNAGHDLAGGRDAVLTLAAWLQMLLDQQPLPRIEWRITETPAGATMRATTTVPARRALAWLADSADRDFRDERWSSRDLPLTSDGREAELAVARPGAGYRAYLIEFVFAASTGEEYRLSTEARVTPDTQP